MISISMHRDHAQSWKLEILHSDSAIHVKTIDFQTEHYVTRTPTVGLPSHNKNDRKWEDATLHRAENEWAN